MQPGMNVGPYRIIEQIGLGGMATVFKAYEPGMDRYVAVKIVSPQFAQHPEFRERFRREAKSIARLEHPHIVPVFSYGEESGTAYLVLRYMETGTLSDLMNHKPMEFHKAEHLIEQIAGALDYAHRNGVIHRDVKPSNVLIDSEGNAYLTDFGIAKIVEATVELTGTGTAMGTPQYMSPEQCRGDKDLTDATDTYSLGVILYQMVTGTLPFDAETPLAVIHQHLNAQLPPPHTTNPQVTDAMERVLFKALAKDPGDRFASTSDLAGAFSAAVSKLETVAVPAARVESKPGPVGELAHPETVGRPTRRLPRWAWAGGGLLVAAVLIGGLLASGTIELPGGSEPAVETPMAEVAAVPPTEPPTERPAEPEPEAAEPVPEAGPQAVSVNLGPANAVRGLSQVEDVGDGLTAPAAIGGREARVTLPNGTGGRYIYFDVDNSFMLNEPGPVVISVEYFDQGSQILGLHYDSTTRTDQGAFKVTDDVPLEDSGEWRTAVFVLEDAYFSGRQHDGADFRIHAGGEFDLYIDQVTVARLGSPMAEAIADPWGHVFLSPGEPVTFGMAPGFGSPLSEAMATDQYDAVSLALERFGPIYGSPIELFAVESGCTPEAGRLSAEQLVTASGLVAVVGPTCSTAVGEAMFVFEAAHVVFITPSGTQGSLDQPGLATFNRTALADGMAPGGDSAAVDPDDPIYQEFAADFESVVGRPCCEPFAPHAFDAAKILLNAIREVAVVDETGAMVIPRLRLAEFVRHTEIWPGASGVITFDEAGNRLLP